MKKLIIFSRHGLRYPLLKYESMQGIISKKDVNWDFEEGMLTEKGEILEFKMGIFLRKYIEKFGKKFKKIEFSSNSIKRTVATAKILATSMFPYREIEVKFKDKTFSTMEKDFNIYLDSLDINKEKLKKLDYRLKPQYERLEKILNIEDGTFLNIGSNIKIGENGFLMSDGAFKIATDIVDMYILKYFEGFKEQNIFKSDNFYKDLEYISEIKDSLLDTIFGDLDYINDSPTEITKLIQSKINSETDLDVIVGHDSNIATIFAKLGINLDYKILEKYPIGAKLLFKVYDDNSFDLELIYYKPESIRNMNNDNPVIVNLGERLKF
ncbi:histidine-type phosphatase [Pseudostreptobacillus sp.]